MANLSARPYRVRVFDATGTPLELVIEYFNLTQEAYQAESYPARNLEILVSEATTIKSPTNGSIDPEVNPQFFSYGQTVTLDLQLTTNVWHQVYSGRIVQMTPNDGRQALDVSTPRTQRTLLIRCGDVLSEAAFPEYPFDVSEVTLGQGTSVTGVVDKILTYKKVPIVSAPFPAFPFSTAVGIPFNPQSSSNAIDFCHKLFWCNPLTDLSPQYLWVDRLGQVRRSTLPLAPSTFLINTDTGSGLVPEYLDNTDPRETPPGEITITGQIDYVEEAADFTSEPTIVYGNLRLPAEPLVITEATETTPAVVESTTSGFGELSRTQTSYAIVPLLRREINTTRVSQAGGLIFRKHPQLIQEDRGLTIAPINFYRNWRLPLLNEITTETKFYEGPRDRLTRIETITTALEGSIDQNNTLLGRTTKEEVTVTYDYTVDGVISSITTATRQARGVADSAATEDLFELVATEEIIEKWTTPVFSRDSDRYVYSRSVTRPFFDNDTTVETNNAASQPPETEFFPGTFEQRSRDVSCTAQFVYGSGIPNKNRTFDYGNALLSDNNCLRSAGIEALLIYGQTFAKDIVFSLTDTVIQGLWPSGTDFSPFLKITDLTTSRTYVYLMDSIEIRGERDRLVGRCYALRLSVEQAGLIDNQVVRIPSFRATATNQLRVTDTGQFRVNS